MNEEEINRRIENASHKELEKIYYELVKKNTMYLIPEQVERMNLLAVTIKNINQKK